MLDNWKDQDFTDIFSEFRGKILKLSIQKFSSHVIEKALE